MSTHLSCTVCIVLCHVTLHLMLIKYVLFSQQSKCLTYSKYIYVGIHLNILPFTFKVVLEEYLTRLEGSLEVTGKTITVHQLTRSTLEVSQFSIMSYNNVLIS